MIINKILKIINMACWSLLEKTPLNTNEKKSLKTRANAYGLKFVNTPKLKQNINPRKRQHKDSTIFRKFALDNKVLSSLELVRLHMLYTQLERIKEYDVSGAIAEVGVYQGRTAHLFASMDTEKEIYLFDTFEGHPENAFVSEDGKPYVDYIKNIRNLNDTSIDLVKQNIGKIDDVIIKQGYFPDSAKGLEEVTFAFVHLDADQYQSIKDGLIFFYPRMSPGGAIICHDYGIYEGVRKAVDEFFINKPEVPVEMCDNCGSVLVTINY